MADPRHITEKNHRPRPSFLKNVVFGVLAGAGFSFIYAGAYPGAGNLFSGMAIGAIVGLFIGFRVKR